MAAVMGGVWAAGCLDWAAEFPENRWSPFQRMTVERLGSVHADAERIRASRQEIKVEPELLDVRAVLHAHAEDSDHTGGTLAEMLEDARRAGVRVILLTDHHRPPRDFITAARRGERDGVLLIPGAEARGFLVYPAQSVMNRMEQPVDPWLAAVRSDGGLAFLSHVEERPAQPTDRLDGMEIYNRHYDAKRDPTTLVGLALQMTDPQLARQLADSLRRFPDEMFAAQVSYPEVYLKKWDADALARRLTGVAANDCHHNQVLIVKKVDDETVLIGTRVDEEDEMRKVTATWRPGIRELTRGKPAGEVLIEMDFDPYFRSFRNVSTHLRVLEVSESAVREALRQGRVYVSHDWICDPTGFDWVLEDGSERVVARMGDELEWREGLRLKGAAPVACRWRLMRNGVAMALEEGSGATWAVSGPGVYRVEAWLRLDGEDRPWIYSNPIYLR
jgi:nicotinamidase-related amidase